MQMNAPLAGMLTAYRALADALRRPSSPWHRGLRWVERPREQAALRVGMDPRHDPPNRLAGPAGRVPIEWVVSRRAATAHQWLKVENTDCSVGHGTLAALLRSDGANPRLFGLTAGHVLGGDPAARFGNRVDLSALGRDERRLAGRVFNWSPDLSRTDRAVEVDAGLVILDEAAVMPIIDEADWPLGWAAAVEGDAVRLLTRQHRLPGTVAARLTAAVDVGDPPQRYVLKDALCCRIDGGSLPGDSGAALWNVEQMLVGLNVGTAPDGSPGNTLATPIGRVLAWAGARPVLRGEAFGDEGREEPPSAAGLTIPAAPAREADVLARTMWGEARGESDARAGMAAIAHVVLNRRDRRSWWGREVESICLHPWQFSCWNANDPNRPKLVAVQRPDALFSLALDVAADVLSMTDAARRLADPTQGATHYHVQGLHPAWARNGRPCAVIGRHVFYRDIA
jgi:hypothetical protein